MSELFDESLISDFVAESREHLDEIEPDLLAMEGDESNVDQELINRVFRAIHSVKGGAGFLAFENLKNLSHIMEGVLVQVRDGQYSLTSEITNVLLSGVDKLRAMVDDIQSSEDVICSDEISKLTAIQESGGQLSGAGDSSSSAATPASVEEKVEEAPEPSKLTDSFVAAMKPFIQKNADLKVKMGGGRFVYCAEVDIQKDIKDKSLTISVFLENIASLGKVIDSSIDLDDADKLSKAEETEKSFSFLFTTVIEKDLIDVAIDISEGKINLLSEEIIDQVSAIPDPADQPETKKAGTPNAKTKKADAKGAVEVTETLRVRVDLLTRLMNLAGELVLSRNQLVRAFGDLDLNNSNINNILQNVDMVTTEVQEGIMQTRMQPVGSVFGKFPRVVRDISQQLEKKIRIDITGSEVEMDKSIIELLSDPLTHIIRNSADHALEGPEERVLNGKDETGVIQLKAYHEAGQINIAIIDDGRGIDPEKIGAKAVEKGVVTEDQLAKMSPRDIVNLVFAAGFSTAEVVSEVSGRGVGMDVVRSNIEKLGGTVNLDSVLGEGTTVLLQLPLTLAIIPSLIIGVSEQQFAIPQVNVDEFVWVRANEVADRIERLRGKDILKLRGQLLPLIRLSDVLGMDRMYKNSETGEWEPCRRTRIADRRGPDDMVAAADPELLEQNRENEDRRQHYTGDYNIVVLKVGTNQFGLIVDQYYDTEETVVKPLSTFLSQCACFSGATILGDGSVITILDVLGVANKAELKFTDLDTEERRRKEEEEAREAAAAAERKSVILFRSAPEELFAVPQDLVLRLERIQTEDIEQIGDREYVQYRGQGLPIIRLENYLSVNPIPTDLEEVYLIIPKTKDAAENGKAGIIVSSIEDALDVHVALEQSDHDANGVMGSAIVNEKLTMFLNLTELMDKTPAVA
jgi:two-component system chemotaxis sensor kinase CheA